MRQQEVTPMTAREREAAFLSAAEDGFAISLSLKH